MRKSDRTDYTIQKSLMKKSREKTNENGVEL